MAAKKKGRRREDDSRLEPGLYAVSGAVGAHDTHQVAAVVFEVEQAARSGKDLSVPAWAVRVLADELRALRALVSLRLREARPRRGAGRRGGEYDRDAVLLMFMLRYDVARVMSVPGEALRDALARMTREGFPPGDAVRKWLLRQRPAMRAWLAEPHGKDEAAAWRTALYRRVLDVLAAGADKKPT